MDTIEYCFTCDTRLDELDEEDRDFHWFHEKHETGFVNKNDVIKREKQINDALNMLKVNILNYFNKNPYKWY